MLPHVSQPQILSSQAVGPLLPLERSASTALLEAIAPLPRFNASYAVVFIRDGAKKRRDLAYARARDLQRELGVLPALQCVPSLP